MTDKWIIALLVIVVCGQAATDAWDGYKCGGIIEAAVTFIIGVVGYSLILGIVLAAPMLISATCEAQSGLK